MRVLMNSALPEVDYCGQEDGPQNFGAKNMMPRLLLHQVVHSNIKKQVEIFNSYH